MLDNRLDLIYKTRLLLELEDIFVFRSKLQTVRSDRSANNKTNRVSI